VGRIKNQREREGNLSVGRENTLLSFRENNILNVPFRVAE